MGATPAKRAEVAARRAKAIQLNLAGVDYERIAEQLGYKSVQHVSVDIHRALENHLKEQRLALDLHVQLELDRLERLQAAFWGAALQGDPKAGDMVMKIMARRAKMMGTDSTLKVEITTIDQVEAEIRELRQRLALNDTQNVPVEP
jgi:hypothetical protein